MYCLHWANLIGNTELEKAARVYCSSLNSSIILSNLKRPQMVHSYPQNCSPRLISCSSRKMLENKILSLWILLLFMVSQLEKVIGIPLLCQTCGAQCKWHPISISYHALFCLQENNANENEDVLTEKVMRKPIDYTDILAPDVLWIIQDKKETISLSERGFIWISFIKCKMHTVY